MAITYEKTWQLSQNQAMLTTTTSVTWHNMCWWIKAFLCGQLENSAYKDGYGDPLTEFRGLWTVYYSCDSSTAGTAGDGYDRWGTQGATTGASGSSANIVSGATIPGAVRLTGLSGMSASNVGNFITITGAASSNNNSPTETPFKIVNYVSSSSVDIYNPLAIVDDANNGSISWTERGSFSFTDAKIVGNSGAHSWIVLKSPPALGPYYLILDLNSSTVGTLSVSISKMAPTGGTTSARPTAVDEVYLTNWATQSIFNAVTPVGRTHGGLATDGNFHIMTSSDGNGWRSVIMFQILTDAKSNNPYKFVMWFRGSATLPTFANAAGVVGNFGTRHISGLSTIQPYGVAFTTTSSQTGDCLNALMNTVDFTDSMYGHLPIYMYSASTQGVRSILGRFADYRWAPTGITSGTVSPDTTNPISMKVGDMWFPCYTVPVI